jgi:SET domain-containing protein
LIRTPLGGFYNHSDNPNCETYALEYLGYRKLRAIKDIKAGEELTAYYTLYSILNHEHDWDRLHTDSRQEWTDEYYQCECGEEKIVRTEHEVSVE